MAACEPDMAELGFRRGRRSAREPSIEYGVPRFKVTVEYAGTRFSGWQIQKNARTVQGEIDRAVRAVSRRQDFELYGSGRTDAGVHAAGQVAHLDVVTSLPAETLKRRINDELPADINVLDMTPVPHRFHARHDAVGRRYLYQIARRRTAFSKPFVWWVKEELDLVRMAQAARIFIGMRDFRSFARLEEDEATDERAGKSTTVLIERLDVVSAGELVLVAIEGSHFLWRMVRRIVGVLVEIGQGQLEPAAVSRFLTEASEAPARLTAPPSGLFLERVYYRNDPRPAPLRAITPLGRFELAG
jgi:tRNA pseudouridine38-40 synthase